MTATSGTKGGPFGQPRQFVLWDNEGAVVTRVVAPPNMTAQRMKSVLEYLFAAPDPSADAILSGIEAARAENRDDMADFLSAELAREAIRPVAARVTLILIPTNLERATRA